MNEKKFFCDFFDKHYTTKRVVLIMFVFSVISAFVSYNINYKTYTKELSKYSAEDYTYLSEFATTLYDSKNKTLKLFNMPDNVSISNISYTDDSMTFQCLLDKDFWFVSNPVVHVKISKALNNIEITGSNKEVATNKITLVILSICFGLLFVWLPFLLIHILLVTISGISYLRKRRYLKSKYKKYYF